MQPYPTEDTRAQAADRATRASHPLYDQPHPGDSLREDTQAEAPVIGRVIRIYAALRDAEVVLNRLAEKLTPVLAEAHPTKEDETAKEDTDSPLATHLNSIEYRIALLNRDIQELTARVDL